MNIVLRTEGYNPSIEEAEFTLDELKQVITYMKSSKLPFVSFIGKSPTMHSRFFDFIEECIKQDVYVRINLDTGDLLDNDIIERLAKIASINNTEKDKVGFMLDLTRYSSTDDDIVFAIKKLGKWSATSITVGYNELDMEKIYQTIIDNNMVPIVKIGFSLPTPNNIYDPLKLEDYKEKTKCFIDGVQLRRKHGIGLVLECGTPVCEFSKEQIGELYTSPMNSFTFSCLPRSEILPGLKVAFCSVLADKTAVDLNDFNDFNELLHYLAVYFKNYDSIYGKCNTCEFKENLCGGGCKGYRLINNE